MVEEYMEFLMGVAMQDVIDAPKKDVDVALPTSRTERLVMCVHQIRFDMGAELVDAADTRKLAFACLARQTECWALDISDPRVVDRATAMTDIVNTGLAKWSECEIHYFDPPFILADRQLWFSFDTTNFNAISKAEFRIGYTLRKVSESAFIAALVSY